MPAKDRSETEAHPEFDPSGGVGELSRDLYRAMCRAIDARVASYGLTSQTCRYLSIIRRAGGATAKELSDYLSVRSPTTVGALNTLEAKRLVKRTTDPKDGRKAIYILTPRGAEVEALVFDAATDVERRATRSLSPQERKLFRKMARSIHASILDDLHETGPTAHQHAKPRTSRAKRP